MASVIDSFTEAIDRLFFYSIDSPYPIATDTDSRAGKEEKE